MARILLIEDNDALRPLLRMSLEQAGHEVDDACHGGEGLRLYRERPADLVVCDLFMPVKDGLETIRELRAGGDVKIIAVSGDGPAGSSAMLEVARALGAAKVLSKPVDAETLLEAIGEVLKATEQDPPNPAGPISRRRAGGWIVYSGPAAPTEDGLSAAG